MRSSKHESNSIYSKISQSDDFRKDLQRANTIHHQSQDYMNHVDFGSVNFHEEKNKDLTLISNDPSQREFNADILRIRNKEEVRSKFQNIYKPKNEEKKDFKIQFSGKSLDNEKRHQRRDHDGLGNIHKMRSSRPDTTKQTPSGVDSKGAESETSSLYYYQKNGNDSGFLPFPRSIKLRDDHGNLSKLSDIKDNTNFGLKDFYSGKNVGYNLNQREEYGILSGNILFLIN
jgi:hypothetical protein